VIVKRLGSEEPPEALAAAWHAHVRRIARIGQ
jgi:hypothetical protein